MKRMMLAIVTTASLMSVAAPGFAEDGESVDHRLGEEINRICFRPTIAAWRTVDRLDNVILLRQGVSNWYYVELLGACSNNILRSAIQIGIDSRPGANCVTRGDLILVRDNPSQVRRCNVQRIYEWDDDAKAPEREDETINESN